MIVDLTDTTTSDISNALIAARRRSGSPMMGMVLTTVVVTDEQGAYDAIRAATAAARAHPSRILVVINRGGRVPARLDAEVRIGGDTGSTGEVLVLRTYGDLSGHADSVVLPLLLPDTPVVAWWPGQAPRPMCADPIGALANRRIADAAASPRPLTALAERLDGYCPGDTDLAWTRATSWRTLLAAALDEPYDRIAAVQVAAERDNPSAELLALWLEMRLGVDVERRVSEGPGVTAVRLFTASGEISLTRGDGRLAALGRPGQPDRSVALPRRDLADLLAEELRHLDPDETFASTLARLRVPTSA